MSRRICEGRVVSVFTRLCRAVCPSGCRWWIIQTPGLGHCWEEREGGLIGLLCSQRAHDQNVLPRCAQWETNSGLPPGEDTSKLGWTIGDTGHSENAARLLPPAQYRRRHRDRFAPAPG
jgi:hypothetical protein